MTRSATKATNGILLRALQNAGADSFLVNVILLHHSSPVRKLRGLLELVQRGSQVRASSISTSWSSTASRNPGRFWTGMQGERASDDADSERA